MWFNAKFFVSFSYCAPSFVLYTLLIVMLLKNWKDFNSAFFKMVITDYFVNVLTWLNSMITLRLPNGTCKNCSMSAIFSELGQNNTYTEKFLFFNYFLHFGNAYFQYAMITLMSFNRTTSIFFYFVNEKIWKYAFPISIASIIGITTFLARTILQTVPFYTYYEALDMYSIKSDLNILPAYNNVINFMALSVSLSVFFNIVSVVRLKMIQTKISAVERNLLLVTLVSSLIQSFAAMNTFILQIDVQRVTVWGQTAQILLPFSSDFLTICQPYILIFLSSKVRGGFLQTYYLPQSKVNEMFTKTNSIGSTSSRITRF